MQEKPYKPKAIHRPKGYDYFRHGNPEIKTKASNPEYRSGWDRIFNKDKQTIYFEVR